MNPTFEQARRYGFVFPHARMWATPENRARIAQDAALITTPNTTVPAELLAYIDPMVIEILTAPPARRRNLRGREKRRLDDPVHEVARGRNDREDRAVFRLCQRHDFGRELGMARPRVQYVFQTSITYGDFEVEMSSTAKVNLAASKQRAAANVIDIDQNRFYLLGVAGKEIYGILNDPNLPAAITAEATGTGSSTKWADKTTVQIYNDVLALFAQLSEQSSGLIDKDTPLKLCLSPELAVRLGAATDFNVSVLDMLKRYFSRIDIVTVPELHSMTAGETMFLIAPEVNGQRSGTLAFGEKMRAGRVVPDLSSFRQKFVGTTYGGIVLMPFAFAQMTGM